MEDCSMHEVQRVRRRGRRTMLLFSGWSDRRLHLIASGASVPIVQQDCRVPSDSLVHSRGEICMWVDIAWTSPVAERVASVASLACGLWCGRIFWDRIQSWLLHSWQIEACPWDLLAYPQAGSCSNQFLKLPDCSLECERHLLVGNGGMIWFDGARRSICRRCCSRAERSSVASRSWRLGRALPCSDEYYHRWDRSECGRVDFGVVRWRSRETRFYLDSVWVCWRRTTRLFRWCTRRLKDRRSCVSFGFPDR